jgi:hypothetical protein
MGYCGSVPSVGVWNGYRVMVNTEDHPPAHVHVIKDDKAILIRLDGCKAYRAKGKPTIVMIREADRIVSEHIAECKAEWEKWHG